MGLGVAGELKAWCLEGGTKRHRQENSRNPGENLQGPPDLHVHRGKPCTFPLVGGMVPEGCNRFPSPGRPGDLL